MESWSELGVIYELIYQSNGRQMMEASAPAGDSQRFMRLQAVGPLLGLSHKSRVAKAAALRDDAVMNWLVWSLLSAFFAGLTAILAKVGVKDVDSNLATAVRTTVILVFGWIVYFMTNKPNAVFGLTQKNWLFLALSGAATGLSWMCYFRALQMGEASKVAPIDKLSVVFVLIFAAVFLGEALTWKTGLGGALIVAGAIVLTLK